MLIVFPNNYLKSSSSIPNANFKSIQININGKIQKIDFFNNEQKLLKEIDITGKEEIFTVSDKNNAISFTDDETKNRIVKIMSKRKKPLKFKKRLETWAEKSQNGKFVFVVNSTLVFVDNNLNEDAISMKEQILVYDQTGNEIFKLNKGGIPSISPNGDYIFLRDEVNLISELYKINGNNIGTFDRFYTAVFSPNENYLLLYEFQKDKILFAVYNIKNANIIKNCAFNLDKNIGYRYYGDLMEMHDDGKVFLVRNNYKEKIYDEKYEVTF